MSWLSSLVKGAGKVIKSALPIAASFIPGIGGTLGKVLNSPVGQVGASLLGANPSSAGGGTNWGDIANTALGIYGQKRAGDAVDNQINSANSAIKNQIKVGQQYYDETAPLRQAYIGSQVGMNPIRSGMQKSLAYMLDPSLANSGGTDRAPGATPVSGGAHLLGGVMDVPDWQKTGQQVQDAYQTAGLIGAQDQYGAARSDSNADLARRGLLGGDNSVQLGRNTALNAGEARARGLAGADALNARLGVEGNLRNEGYNKFMGGLDYLNADSANLRPFMDPSTVMQGYSSAAGAQTNLANVNANAGDMSGWWNYLGQKQAYNEVQPTAPSAPTTPSTPGTLGTFPGMPQSVSGYYDPTKYVNPALRTVGSSPAFYLSR